MAALASIGLSALEWVASHLLKKLLDECFASFGTDTEKKLQKLRDTVLPLLKSVIEKAEGSPNRSELEDRLQRLKDAYDEGEDALDLLDYYRLRREVRYSSRIPKRVRCVAPILEGSQDMLSPRMIKLRRSLNKYEKIESEAEKLRAELGAVCESGQTTSVPPARVFGRDKDREEIIQRLKTEPAAATRDPGSSSSSGVPIIAIVGRPGIGKTTLAQYVYEQLGSECGGGRFYPVVWVFSSHNFTASEIMKEIIQQASIASGSQDLGNLHSPQALQLRMKEQLKEKKFLLVIDDVRCDGEDHENNWKMLRCLSKCRSPGSKILVTSQTDDAPAKIGAAIGAAIEHTLHLAELEESGFLDLFIHYALPGGVTDPCLREDLEENLETIARKLSKDPTAAETVGTTIATEIARLSRSQDDRRTYLERVAEEDWSGNKTKAFTWSYRQLPAHLQRCFSYCSLYPKGYRFEALELVQLWMAQGFIKPDDQNKRMEDAGNDYLKELVSRFYIQPLNRVRRSFGTEKPDSCYTLHELLYDLAEKVTRNYCVRIEGNRREKIPSTIRHLCIPADKLNENEEEICKLKKLRTLIVTSGESVTSGENVATDIFKSLKKLRVLVLELNLEDLAKFISEMKHLRILQVSSTSEFVLPESVCTLYHLQVLRVKSAMLLPKFLNNLVSLRYLEANFEKISVIPNISKLTSLQCLEKFPVSKEKGNELEQLQNLNELQGCLCIANLENVKSKKSAISANLKDKKHLRMLQLVWCDGEDNVNPNMDAEILEGLQLPPNLTTLHLDGYRGRSWPSWPECQTSDIEELAPKRCGMLEELPPMDRLYPSCTSLKLAHRSRLEALHTLPPRLKKFRIFRTPFLAFVTKEDLEMSPAKKRSIIEDLEVMRKSMPKWFLHQHQESLVNDEKEMMNFIASTSDSNNNEAAEHNKSAPAADVAISDDWERWLEIHKRKMELIYNRQNEAKLLLPSNLTELTLKGCNITNHALSACLQTLTSLTCLELAEIRTITRLPSMVALAKLKALQTLHIRDCWGVTSLGGIKALHHLRKLLLIGCLCLDSKTAFLPSSLQSILFESCADVDVILANADLLCLSNLMITRCIMRNTSLQLGTLRSLDFLGIEHCHGLSLLGGVQNLHSLKFLILNNCPNLQAVMNLPSSLESLGIRRCPIFRGAIPVEDDFEHDLKCRKEVTDEQ